MLGSGLLKGMAVTAKNFVESYYDEDRMTTVQYPEEPSVKTETYRNFPFLVYDGKPDNLRCVACTICEKECPPQCIYIEVARDEKGRPAKRPAVFDIDVSVCMSCQICVETCPFEAIKMDQEFELARDNRFSGLLFNKERLLKSNEYFHSIRPHEADEVDARLAAKTKKAAPAAKPASPAAAAAAPGTQSVQKTPAPAPAPAPKGITIPEDAPFTPEQREWLGKFLSQIGASASPARAASSGAASEASPGAPAAEPQAEPAAEEGGDPDLTNDVPWHDPDKGLGERMKLAQGKPLPVQLYAAMGQTDCTACGYDCKGYAMALAAGQEKDPGLCVPGAEETEVKVRELLEKAGIKVD
ncbi:MAG: 4Fe-4S dicluster domain-containing protein [Verrucomicrobiae bacterium]|nr:4Fe-4S dicluster domain-containing protein [Verrucomicrobiae bacterium]